MNKPVFLKLDDGSYAVHVKANARPLSPAVQAAIDNLRTVVQKECKHDWFEAEEDYGSLGSGGSYVRYECRTCNKSEWSALPD